MIESLKFEFCYKTSFSQSFRTKTLCGQYDLDNKEITQCFNGDFKLPNNWNVGLIVGNSGSGKTSIARECFGEFSELEWDRRALIENFDDDLSMSDITKNLGAVGFNSVPFWLKPFNVLSNGEKARVELARMCAEREFVLYDEFTSLVDRDVAKSMANSVQKLFRKSKKQFVAVTCHHDIIEWLRPDWYYDTDKKEFFEGKSLGVRSSNLILSESKKSIGNIIKSIII